MTVENDQALTEQETVEELIKHAIENKHDVPEVIKNKYEYKASTILKHAVKHT